MIQNYPKQFNEFTGRYETTVQESKGEWGETRIEGSMPDTTDRVDLSSSRGEFGSGQEVSGTIGGQRVDVYVTTDEWGNREVFGAGKELYERLNPEKKSSYDDWM